MQDLIDRQQGRKAERMNDWMIFAERLSEQMKKQNLSIRQLAKRMDMTPTTIFRYARGQRVPRGSEILKASNVLGVTCDYLMGLSDDPKKTSRPSAQPEDYAEMKQEFLRMASYIDVLLECSDEQKETLLGFISRLSEFMPWKEKD